MITTQTHKIEIEYTPISLNLANKSANFLKPWILKRAQRHG